MSEADERDCLLVKSDEIHKNPSCCLISKSDWELDSKMLFAFSSICIMRRTLLKLKFDRKLIFESRLATLGMTESHLPVAFISFHVLFTLKFLEPTSKNRLA